MNSVQSIFWLVLLVSSSIEIGAENHLSTGQQQSVDAPLVERKSEETPTSALKEKADVVTTNKRRHKISIVVDDLGDNSVIAKKMLALPGKLTVAILPQTPHAELISNLASDYGHEIIMHLPMEAFSRPDLLGPGALLSTMDHETFNRTFEKSFNSIPNVVGFNNHMGSLLTEDKEKMQWLMDLAKLRSVYFLDSKTSDESIAQEVAKNSGVQTIGRDIFLDHKSKDNSLKIQLERTKRIARKIGKAVLICHPYPETLAFLRNNIEYLSEEFILVGLSELLDSEIKGSIQPSMAR